MLWTRSESEDAIEKPSIFDKQDHTGPLSAPLREPLAESSQPQRPHIDEALWKARQRKVVAAFEHSWSAYAKDAFGMDEYKPLSHSGSNLIPNGMGFTIVDSLDTILLMKLEGPFEQARKWVEKSLNFNQDKPVNVFETTIRVLGGLLSAYHLSGNDKVFLNKAIDLADRLLPAFDSPSKIPFASINLHSGEPVKAHFNAGASSTAEATTLQLEFKYLAQITGKKKYWDAAEKVMIRMYEIEKPDGLVPIFINPDSGEFWGSEIRLGSRGDSYYEYLLKQYLQTNGSEPVYREMYDESVRGIKRHLVQYSYPSSLLYLAELPNGLSSPRLHPKMDHLVCFIGGSFALGATEGYTVPTFDPKQLKQFPARLTSDLSPHVRAEDLNMGAELTKTCAQMYFRTATGLAPEIAYFRTDESDMSEGVRGLTDDMYIKALDAHNLQRPETVESLFILWRTTGDVKYRDWGWKIFEAFEKHTRIETGGHASLDSVEENPPHKRDKMETFWLAETLKYLYLLFGDDDLIPLSEYVFNTEAHPLPIFAPKEKFLSEFSKKKV